MSRRAEKGLAVDRDAGYSEEGDRLEARAWPKSEKLDSARNGRTET